MLRIVWVGGAQPMSLPVDPSAQFQPGMLAQLTVVGQRVVAGVSNGFAPIAIIDDIKTMSFSNNSYDETVIVPATGVPGPGGSVITPVDIRTELINPNVFPDSFISIPVPVQLVPRNGVVVFPAGTALNYDLLGTGTPNAIKTLVRYSYQIPNILGEDSTLASQKVTLWFERMIFETNQFETNQLYQINSNLFSSECGLLTTRQYAPNLPSIAIVTAAPTALTPTLQAMWL